MLNVRQLTPRWGSKVAWEALSFALPQGGFNALLRPNGAGKLALFQVMTDLFAANEGDVEKAGLSVRRSARQALAHIGVVFQQQSLDLDHSALRNLQFQADLQGLPRALAVTRIAAEAERMKLTDHLSKKCS